MKKIILYAAALMLTTASVMAAAPGSKLMQKFNSTFPNAQNIKWRDDTNGYFVSFTQNGNYNKAFYNKTGEFIYSLKYFSGDKLPTNIIMVLNDKYGQANIIGVTEVTTPANTVYNIKLQKAEELHCLNVSTNGAIINEENFVTKQPE